MSMDTKILEQRLITKDSVRGSASISRTAERLSSLRTNLSDKVALENFLREITMLRLEIDKSCRTYDSYAKQVAEYRELQDNVNEQSHGAAREIEHLKIQREQENRIRSHRRVCELYAQEVNTHKRRSYLERNISQLEENLAHTKKGMETTQIDIRTRKGQFDLLLTALMDLESQIKQTNGIEDETYEDNLYRGERRDNYDAQCSMENDIINAEMHESCKTLDENLVDGVIEDL